MKVVILAGGLGTRLVEETQVIPKPMVEIGGRPIVWHIMKHYAKFGHNEFLMALGYRGEVAKRYFAEYFTVNSDLTVDLSNGQVEVDERDREDWRVHLIDTGLETMTGGRLLRLAPHVADETFMLTYGDGVSDVNLDKLVEFHRSHGKQATVLAVRPPARFGELAFEAPDSDLPRLSEKPNLAEGWVNGGFMILEPRAIDLISDDQASLEIDLLEKLSVAGELAAMRHEGFWQCMDTVRDLRMLREWWDSGDAPWKTWQ